MGQLSLYVYNGSMQVYQLFCCNADVDASKKTSLPHQLVEQALLLYQFGRCIELGHTSVVKHHDAVTVKDRVDAVGDRNDRPILEHVASESGLQQCIRLHINSGLE